MRASSYTETIRSICAMSQLGHEAKNSIYRPRRRFAASRLADGRSSRSLGQTQIVNRARLLGPRKRDGCPAGVDTVEKVSPKEAVEFEFETMEPGQIDF